MNLLEAGSAGLWTCQGCIETSQENLHFDRTLQSRLLGFVVVRSFGLRYIYN